MLKSLCLSYDRKKIYTDLYINVTWANIPYLFKSFHCFMRFTQIFVWHYYLKILLRHYLSYYSVIFNGLVSKMSK